MTEQAKETARQIFNGLEHTMIDLYSRWRDEHEYEDIADYGKVIRGTVNTFADVKFIKMHKSPFGFTYEINGGIVQVIMTSREYKWRWKRI